MASSLEKKLNCVLFCESRPNNFSPVRSSIAATKPNPSTWKVSMNLLMVKVPDQLNAGFPRLARGVFKLGGSKFPALLMHLFCLEHLVL